MTASKCPESYLRNPEYSIMHLQSLTFSRSLAFDESADLGKWIGEISDAARASVERDSQALMMGLPDSGGAYIWDYLGDGYWYLRNIKLERRTNSRPQNICNAASGHWSVHENVSTTNVYR